jgi:CO/xanthine dehydrogenase Mo-binding subunit
MVEKAARQLGIKPEVIRRKNLLDPEQFPYKSATGNLYDSGNYQAVLDDALGKIDLEHWRAEKERARAEGRHIGIGVATTQERSVFSSTEFWYWFDEPSFPITSSPESATVTIDAVGEVQVTLHSQAMWGNSPETMVSMVVAEELGVDPYSVNVAYANTSSGFPDTGPGGSRYTVMVTGAVRGATRALKDKLCRIGAKDLETAVEDVEYTDGAVRVKGAPSRSKSLAELAATAYFFALNLPEGERSGLEEGYTYDHPYTTLPNADRTDLGVFYPFMGHACHIAVIEIDPVTGKITWLDYVAVHDAGTVVNPPTLAGQVLGGTVQGIGTTLWEEYVYDEAGELHTGSLWDYQIPRATDAPQMRLGHVETPSPFTEYGIKGGGEGGRMVVPSALSAAIDDVLAEAGDRRVTELPVKPWQIVEMMEGGA